MLWPPVSPYTSYLYHSDNSTCRVCIKSLVLTVLVDHLVQYIAARINRTPASIGLSSYRISSDEHRERGPKSRDILITWHTTPVTYYSCDAVLGNFYFADNQLGYPSLWRGLNSKLINNKPSKRIQQQTGQIIIYYMVYERATSTPFISLIRFVAQFLHADLWVDLTWLLVVHISVWCLIQHLTFMFRTNLSVSLLIYKERVLS